MANIISNSNHLITKSTDNVIVICDRKKPIRGLVVEELSKERRRLDVGGRKEEARKVDDLSKWDFFLLKILIPFDVIFLEICSIYATVSSI